MDWKICKMPKRQSKQKQDFNSDSVPFESGSYIRNERIRVPQKEILRRQMEQNKIRKK